MSEDSVLSMVSQSEEFSQIKVSNLSIFFVGNLCKMVDLVQMRHLVCLLLTEEDFPSLMILPLWKQNVVSAHCVFGRFALNFFFFRQNTMVAFFVWKSFHGLLLPLLLSYVLFSFFFGNFFSDIRCETMSWMSWSAIWPKIARSPSRVV